MQGMQQTIQESCFRWKKNTWHVESNCILQPHNIVFHSYGYGLLFLISIIQPAGYQTRDHHGLSMYSAQYTTSVNCCLNDIVTTATLQSLKLLIQEYSSTAYVVFVKYGNKMGFGPEQYNGSSITPIYLTQPLHPIKTRSTNKRRNM